MFRQTRVGPQPVVKLSCFFRVFKNHKKTHTVCPHLLDKKCWAAFGFFWGAYEHVIQSSPSTSVKYVLNQEHAFGMNERSKCLYYYFHMVTNPELFCKLSSLQVLRLSNVCRYVFLEVGGSHEKGTGWPQSTSFSFIPISFRLKLNQHNEVRLNFPCRGLETACSHFLK